MAANGPAAPTVNMRVSRSDLDLIDRAAKAHGTNRSAFMIEAAMAKAEAVLLDKRLFAVDDAIYERFMARLDEPPRIDSRLQRLLSTPAPWEL
ncbi:DUF1778 domain-containing protein [Acidisoma cladoniae]|jgi:uncharacterized protein (DUF1778 family)|uniref:type II toxin-antitoxin system TacA family antitoxin n=1 Tax=Acidisoma cladoniae TaxID=3040935 RepID=UPI00254AB11B|nr:DUF1778 domain-containing protein [Acidisoma sp. PAMC 29798]